MELDFRRERNARGTRREGGGEEQEKVQKMSKIGKEDGTDIRRKEGKGQEAGPDGDRRYACR